MVRDQTTASIFFWRKIPWWFPRTPSGQKKWSSPFSQRICLVSDSCCPEKLSKFQWQKALLHLKIWNKPFLTKIKSKKFTLEISANERTLLSTMSPKPWHLLSISSFKHWDLLSISFSKVPCKNGHQFDSKGPYWTEGEIWTNQLAFKFWTKKSKFCFWISRSAPKCRSNFLERASSIFWKTRPHIKTDSVSSRNETLLLQLSHLSVLVQCISQDKKVLVNVVSEILEVILGQGPFYFHIRSLKFWFSFMTEAKVWKLRLSNFPHLPACPPPPTDQSPGLPEEHSQ